MFDYAAGLKIVNFLLLLFSTIPEPMEMKYQKLAYKTRSFFLLYLTNIGLYLTGVTVGCGLAVKFKRKKDDVRIIHYYLAVTTLGIEGIVTIGYWILYNINPIYVNNPVLYKAGYRRDFLFEILYHIFPLFAVVFESWNLQLKRDYTYYISMITFSMLYYTASDLYAKKHTGSWQYEFLTRLSTKYRIAVFAIFTVLGIGVIELFFYLRRKFHGIKII